MSLSALTQYFNTVHSAAVQALHTHTQTEDTYASPRAEAIPCRTHGGFRRGDGKGTNQLEVLERRQRATVSHCRAPFVAAYHPKRKPLEKILRIGREPPGV